MTPQDFAYWLQGFAEINGAVPDEKQWQVIKDHLALVFEKKTPARSVTELSPKPSPINPISLMDFINNNPFEPKVIC